MARKTKTEWRDSWLWLLTLALVLLIAVYVVLRGGQRPGEMGARGTTAVARHAT